MRQYRMDVVGELWHFACDPSLATSGRWALITAPRGGNSSEGEVRAPSLLPAASHPRRPDHDSTLSSSPTPVRVVLSYSAA